MGGSGVVDELENSNAQPGVPGDEGTALDATRAAAASAGDAPPYDAPADVPAHPGETGDVEEPVEAEAPAEIEELPPPQLDWYILKVQSNREESIREALQRRISIAGLDRYFDQIIVPTEMVTEFKNGKKRTVKRKLYPGYIVVHMELNDDTWFLVRETPGIGDFTGSGGKPSPMLPKEVARIVEKPDVQQGEAQRVDIKCKSGDRVKITEGTFENFEGDVDNVDLSNGRVTVMINIFGRSTPVELEHWQVETL